MKGYYNSLKSLLQQIAYMRKKQDDMFPYSVTKTL